MDAMAGVSHAGDSPQSSTSKRQEKKVYVAVGERESSAMVLWALRNFSNKDSAALVLLHIYSHPKFIPIMGTRIPASQVQEQQLIAHKKMELQKISDILDQHLLLCAQKKVQAEKLVVESDDVAEGLVQLISERHVTALVMGAAADKHYTKKMKALKSKKAQAIEQQADPFCRIWYICKGTLVYHRKDVALSNEAMREDRRNSGDQKRSVDRLTSLSDTWCVSNTWLHEPNRGRQTGRSSPCRSYDNKKDTVREFDKPDNKFQHMLQELESVRKQAYEEKCSREKAERELLEAFQKARDSENMYLGEVKRRNETEEKLTTTMEEVERLAETTDKLCAKLQEECKKSLALEEKTIHLVRIIKKLMLQRDEAVREVEALHAKRGESSATAEGTMHITEISCSEIKEATKNFDHSLVIKKCRGSNQAVSEDLGGVPSYFICPILQDVMSEPLVAADGFTYEAEAIREWIDSGHHTSPMTNLELLHRDLLPNHALRSAIQEWLQTYAN